MFFTAANQQTECWLLNHIVFQEVGGIIQCHSETPQPRNIGRTCKSVGITHDLFQLCFSLTIPVHGRNVRLVLWILQQLIHLIFQQIKLFEQITIGCLQCSIALQELLWRGRFGNVVWLKESQLEIVPFEVYSTTDGAKRRQGKTRCYARQILRQTLQHI